MIFIPVTWVVISTIWDMISSRTKHNFKNKIKYMGFKLSTFLNSLKSKENKLEILKENKLEAIHPLNPDLESLMLGISQMFPDKILLTGSSVLYMSGILRREPNDLDFSLREKLTANEFNHLVNFFQLENNTKDSNSESIPVEKVNDTSVIISMLKYFKFKPEDEFTKNEATKIDIFNHEYVKDKDIIEIFYPLDNNTDHVILKAAHPSIAISYKAKYAYDPRVNKSSQYKHSEDLKDLLLAKKEYDKIITRDLTKPKKNDIVYSTIDTLEEV